MLPRGLNPKTFCLQVSETVAQNARVVSEKAAAVAAVSAGKGRIAEADQLLDGVAYQ